VSSESLTKWNSRFTLQNLITSLSRGFQDFWSSETCFALITQSKLCYSRVFWSPPEREVGVSSESLTKWNSRFTLQNLITSLSQGFQDFWSSETCFALITQSKLCYSRVFWSPLERKVGVSSESLTKWNSRFTLQNLITSLSRGFQDFWSSETCFALITQSKLCYSRVFWSPLERKVGVSSESLTKWNSRFTLQNLITSLSRGFQDFWSSETCFALITQSKLCYSRVFWSPLKRKVGVSSESLTKWNSRFTL